jgi:lipopolysaccharide export system protein LptC
MTAAGVTNRFRLGVAIALSAALALGSFWLLGVMQKKGESEATEVTRTRPDYYVDKFTFVKMAKSRMARYNISGDVMTHFPADDSHEITHPVINYLTSGRPTMVMRSNTAKINSDSSEIRLRGNVDIDRPAFGPTAHFHLKSPYLVLLPDDEIMKTDTPVELTLGTTLLNGTGMVANNATGQLDLSHRVHGRYLPAPHQ